MCWCASCGNTDPDEILQIIEREKITFISLIPTHYNLILNIPEHDRQFDVTSVRKLLCSSAPVRKDMKLAIIDFFSGVDLYEGYGSTEAGIVTTLMPGLASLRMLVTASTDST